MPGPEHHPESLRLGSAASGSAWTVAGRPGTSGATGVALAVGDPAAGEVVGTDLHQHLIAGEKLDPEFGELASCTAEALVPSRLLKGHQVEAISLFLLNDSGRFDHAAGRGLGNVDTLSLVGRHHGISSRW